MKDKKSGTRNILAAVSRGALILAMLSVLPVVARPAQAQSETVLYNFPGTPDGFGPQSGLTPYNGNLYGVTGSGGAGSQGAVFELSPNGVGGWNETVIYSFCSPTCADGYAPANNGSVIFDSAGNLYSAAHLGGADDCGVVYELSPAGSSWTESVLYSFTGAQSDCYPALGLIMDPAGNLYGITGNYGTDTVFELSQSGGVWTEQVIYTFGDNYPYPEFPGLTMDAAGNIYGNTYSTVFELSPNGGGGWNPTVIHTFTGAPKDGLQAEGSLVLDQSGNLYGTTYGGGAKNYGTVYKLTPVTKGKEKGTWKEKILYSFKGTKDGSYPLAGIVFDAGGNIYGTTSEGGGKLNYGTVFELVAPVSTGGYKEKVLWSFNGTDGNQPWDSLILDSTGNLYGTTVYGGSNGYGVVFEVNPR